MSFHSPLLSSLRRPGPEEPTADHDDEFLRIRRPPGGGRHVASGAPRITFGATRAGEHPIFDSHAPQHSPLMQEPQLASVAGTNFRARLQAMSASAVASPPSSTYKYLAGDSTPDAGLGTRRLRFTSLTSSHKQVVPGSLGPITSRGQAGLVCIPPPQATLDEELAHLNLDATSGASTPKKRGAEEASQSAAATPLTPVMGSQTDAASVAPWGPSTFSLLPLQSGKLDAVQWSPMLSKSTLNRGHSKALGVGELCLAAQKDKTGGTNAKQVASQEPTAHNVVVEASSSSQVHPPARLKVRSSGVDVDVDAHSVRMQLLADFPEYGVEPVRLRGMGEAEFVKPGTSLATDAAKKEALRELASLRSDAEVGLVQQQADVPERSITSSPIRKGAKERGSSLSSKVSGVEERLERLKVLRERSSHVLSANDKRDPVSLSFT